MAHIVWKVVKQIQCQRVGELPNCWRNGFTSMIPSPRLVPPIADGPASVPWGWNAIWPAMPAAGREPIPITIPSLNNTSSTDETG